MKKTLAIQNEVEAFLREKLAERLGKLAPAQVELFLKRNPQPIPESKLADAIDLCDRAIRQNEKDPSRLAAFAAGRDGEGRAE